MCRVIRGGSLSGCGNQASDACSWRRQPKTLPTSLFVFGPRSSRCHRVRSPILRRCQSVSHPRIWLSVSPTLRHLSPGLAIVCSNVQVFVAALVVRVSQSSATSSPSCSRSAGHASRCRCVLSQQTLDNPPQLRQSLRCWRSCFLSRLPGRAQHLTAHSSGRSASRPAAE